MKETVFFATTSPRPLRRKGNVLCCRNKICLFTNDTLDSFSRDHNNNDNDCNDDDDDSGDDKTLRQFLQTPFHPTAMLAHNN